MPSQHCLHATNTLTQRKLIAAVLLAWIHHTAFAAELNTTLPGNRTVILDKKITVDLPAQNLDAVLKQFSKQSNMDIAYDTETARKTRSSDVKGTFSRREILQKLLQGSGLSVSFDGDAATITPTPAKENTSIQLDSVEVRAKRFYEIGPLPGLGLTKEEIPGNVQSISAKEIKESHSLSITDLMNRKLQSVTVNDYQGNPFQMDVQYRGFTAGPQIGTPQGLSVFIDGIRVNEPFGDVVNWDMIPMNALSSVDVFPGSNPIFGLNTLGGAFSLKTKDGFNNAGADAEILTGSFGRKQLQVEGGVNNGKFALFGAGNFFLEDGWRVNSPSKVNQLFTKGSFRGEKLDLNLSSLIVQTDLVGNGLVPSQMYAQDREATFTSEDTTKNKLLQFQLSGAFQATENFSITSQIYRRESKRHSLGADAYMDGFGSEQYIQRNLAQGEQFSCNFISTNKYGIPDYYVFDLADPGDFSSNPFIADFLANSSDPSYDLEAQLAALAPNSKNRDLSNDAGSSTYAEQARINFLYYQNLQNSLFTNLTVPELASIETYSNGEASYSLSGGTGIADSRFSTFNVDPLSEGGGNYFYTTDGVKHLVVSIAPVNKDACLQAYDANPAAPLTITNAQNPGGILPDGVLNNLPGVVDGTPVSLITNNNIRQVVDGFSTQFNWNLEKHKLMVGISLDSANASYKNSQRLGLFDENRKAYLSPEDIRDEYAAADVDFANNNFKGTSLTKSIYFSDTWSPIETLHITSAARYNQTRITNKVATRTAFEFFDLAKYRAYPDFYGLCIGSEENCPTTGYKPVDGGRLLKPAETEKFSFYSLNPSLGAIWQIKENLSVYSNWAQGTRVPSVIELGCAFDPRPSGFTGYIDANGNGLQDPDEVVDIPRSLAENRSCTLPTTLSGDPFLPQIKATTYDMGLRGTLGESIQWNIGAYQTDLKNDIYLVSVGAANSYFQTIGETRRRGIEAGISGKKDKLGFSLNYALTDATFQDSFRMNSENNSSAVSSYYNATGDGEVFRFITVKPGDRMPGVPLHNLNANVRYDLTDKWSIALNAVAHSESFLRGNENNEHKSGVTEYITVEIPNGAGGFVQVRQPRQPTNNPGKVSGYATFNFQTSYKLSKEWTASLVVNNIFDKEYFSAGRLGRNPFSPSIYGAIGPGGYNHNSGDWLSTNFLAPGAPRGIWFSLNWHFVPD